MVRNISNAEDLGGFFKTSSHMIRSLVGGRKGSWNEKKISQSSLKVSTNRFNNSVHPKWGKHVK